MIKGLATPRYTAITGRLPAIAEPFCIAGQSRGISQTGPDRQRAHRRPGRVLHLGRPQLQARRQRIIGHG
jgi:hypothetical protein